MNFPNLLGTSLPLTELLAYSLDGFKGSWSFPGKLVWMEGRGGDGREG